MANVAISGDTSGAVTLTVPSTVGTQTATFPAATGTVMVSGNMPTFNAGMSGNQTITNASTTLLQFNQTSWDTSSAFNTSTYAYTPKVAGYYQINGAVYTGGSSNSFISLFLNGNAYLRGEQVTGSGNNLVFNGLVYCNGSTDYLQLYLTNNNGSSITTSNYSFTTQFSGVLARTA